MRLTRQALEPIHDPSSYKFAVGQAEEITKGSEVMIFGTGGLSQNALMAAQALTKQGISAGMANFGTIRPIDKNYISKLTSSRIKLIATCEDHSARGGLGSAVAETLAELGAPVQIHQSGASGKITITFYSGEELQNILHKLGDKDS